MTRLAYIARALGITEAEVIAALQAQPADPRVREHPDGEAYMRQHGLIEGTLAYEIYRVLWQTRPDSEDAVIALLKGVKP